MSVPWEAAGAAFTIFGAVAGVQLFIIRLMIRGAISENNDALLARINGTYVKREVCAVNLRDMERRLSDLEGMGD